MTLMLDELLTDATVNSHETPFQHPQPACAVHVVLLCDMGTPPAQSTVTPCLPTSAEVKAPVGVVSVLLLVDTVASLPDR